MGYENVLTFRMAAQKAHTSVEEIKRAYLAGKLKAKTIGSEKYIISSSLTEWLNDEGPQPLPHLQGKKSKQPRQSKSSTQHNINQKQSSQTMSQSKLRSYLDGSAQPQGNPEEDSIMHEIYDPEVFDHQIPDYYKYNIHSEESYKDFYDDYDDDETGRYD